MLRLFATDLFRNFAFGFAGAAVLILAANGDVRDAALAPPARAAQLPDAPVPAPEFVIAPQGR
jgi:hypothetical protein